MFINFNRFTIKLFIDPFIDVIPLSVKQLLSDIEYNVYINI